MSLIFINIRNLGEVTRYNGQLYRKKLIYGMGLSRIPLANKTTIVKGMLIPTKIPAKTSLSLLSIVHQKSVSLFV